MIKSDKGKIMTSVSGDGICESFIRFHSEFLQLCFLNKPETLCAIRTQAGDRIHTSCLKEIIKLKGLSNKIKLLTRKFKEQDSTLGRVKGRKGSLEMSKFRSLKECNGDGTLISKLGVTVARAAVSELG